MEKKKTKIAATAQVGSKGQVVIPQAIREMFDINPGDIVIFLADIEKGIAIVKNEVVMDMFNNGGLKNE